MMAKFKNFWLKLSFLEDATFLLVYPVITRIYSPTTIYSISKTSKLIIQQKFAIETINKLTKI